MIGGPEYPPEYDAPEPPCVNGNLCECDLCTCQECGEKMILDLNGMTYCPECQWVPEWERRGGRRPIALPPGVEEI